ncbi:MAG: hypothetical protein II179_02850 [Alphaproteobacteria bacterium]|nr:hypothetical protein [Alphaproteobacteria bacterium]
MSVVFMETMDSMDLLKNTDYARQITSIQKKNGVAYSVVLSSGGTDHLVFDRLDSNRKRVGFIVCYPYDGVMGPVCRNLQTAYCRTRNIKNSKTKEKQQGR